MQPYDFPRRVLWFVQYVQRAHVVHRQLLHGTRPQTAKNASLNVWVGIVADSLVWPHILTPCLDARK